MKNASFLIALATTFSFVSCEKPGDDHTKCLPPPPPPISGPAFVKAGSTISLSVDAAGGTWSSSNTSNATVNNSGIVTGIAAGTASIIYALKSSCGTIRAYHTVTVN